MIMSRLLPAAAAAVLAVWSAAASDLPSDLASAEIIGGWREPSGRHVAALRITLAPGWKTYWRAPGDAGLPPQFDWSSSRNVASVTPHWPVPHVFWQNGMRSVGYAGEVVLPLVVAPTAAGEPMRLSGRIDIGVCEDVCVPVSFDLTGDLPAPGAPDAAISRAMDLRPVAAEAAGVTSVTCSVEPIADGIRVRATIAMPRLGAEEAAILELPDPSVWISEAATRREGGVLVATAEMVPPSGRPFTVDRSEMRITVLAGARGVDIRGCTGG
jgi:DsbC/DsbD-like thiol-disulfide interchange protein